MAQEVKDKKKDKVSAKDAISGWLTSNSKKGAEPSLTDYIKFNNEMADVLNTEIANKNTQFGKIGAPVIKLENCSE